MRRSWVGRVVVALGLACVVSCRPGVPVDDAGRPIVTERMRQACPDLGDLDIEAAIIEIDLDRQVGVIKRRAVEFVTERCEDRADDIDACITCNVTIVDEIYGP